MLKITSDGRKLGLDQRVINLDLPDDPNSKVNMCISNITKILRDGQADKPTQLVFCDLSTPKTAPAKKAAKATAGNTRRVHRHRLSNLRQALLRHPLYLRVGVRHSRYAHGDTGGLCVPHQHHCRRYHLHGAGRPCQSTRHPHVRRLDAGQAPRFAIRHSGARLWIKSDCN